MINRMFTAYLASGEYVCRLSIIHMLLVLVLMLVLSIMASAYGAFKVSRIEPSQVIREV